MRKQEVIRYFRMLSRIYKRPCQVILTGAALGTIYGGVRATLDIDFALKLKARSKTQKEKGWQEFARATQEISRRTGIAVQYAEDIDRWSSITYLDYQKHTHLFRRFGLVKVDVLEPPYWAIGKLVRYLDSDIRDLVQILKKTETSWSKVAQVAGAALRKSPKSTACFLFRRNVEDFFCSFGKSIWGRLFDMKQAIYRFHKAAHIQLTP